MIGCLDGKMFVVMSLRHIEKDFSARIPPARGGTIEVMFTVIIDLFGGWVIHPVLGVVVGVTCHHPHAW